MALILKNMYLNCHAAVLASSPISQEAFEKLALNSLKSWILATMRYHLYFGVNGQFELSHCNSSQRCLLP
jgi:hypothetical protein